MAISMFGPAHNLETGELGRVTNNNADGSAFRCVWNDGTAGWYAYADCHVCGDSLVVETAETVSIQINTGALDFETPPESPYYNL